MNAKNLIILLLMLIASISLSAQSPVAPALGDGSSGNPFEIATWQNLYWISAPNTEVASPNYATRMTYHYLQTADIDLTAASPAIATWNSNTGWTPIGNMTNSFSGAYDGGGFGINGLLIDRGGNSQGLFGIVYTDFAIKNLNVQNATIQRTLGGDIVGCGSDVAILVGFLGTGLIENCHVQGSVFGTYNVGGILGLGNNVNYSGPNYAPGVISRCSADVVLQSANNSGNVGGLVGSAVRMLISESYAIGTIYARMTGASGSTYLGGFAASLSYATVADCFSRVNVIRTAGGNAYVIGGFVGFVVNSNLQRCYATGTIRDESNNPVGTDNGFVASIVYQSWNENAANHLLLNNFWDSEASGISTTISNPANGSEAPLGKSTRLMNTMKTFTDKSWDFRGENTNGTDDIWNIGHLRNDNYPFFDWQAPADPDPEVSPAINPNPAHLATDVLTDAQLSWEAGILGNPWGYKINFGTNTPPSNILTNHDNGASLTYDPGELDLDQTYYWQIVPYNALDAVDCPIWSFTTVDVAPAAVPVATTATEIAGTSLKANWNAAANAEGYFLDVAYNDSFTAFHSGYNNRDVEDVTHFTVSGLSHGSRVWYRLRAYNAGGTSANSNSITAYTTPSATDLAFPDDGSTGVENSANMAGVLPNNQYATVFKLWLGTNNPPSNVHNGLEFSAQLSDMGGGNWFYYFFTSISALNLAEGTTYYWRAEAENPGGSGPSSPTWSFTTAGTAAIGNAGLVSPANAAADLPVDTDMAWSAPASGPVPDGYRLYWGLDNPPESYVDRGTNLSYDPGTLQYNRTYYWQAQPYVGANFAQNQEVWSFTTVDYYGTDLDPVDPGTGPVIPSILIPDVTGPFDPPDASSAWAPPGINLPNAGLYVNLSGGSPLAGRKIVINPRLGFIPEQIAWRILPNQSWNLEPRILEGDPWTASYVYFFLPPAKAEGDVEIVFPESEGQTLPVTLAYFNATLSVDNFVSLKWATHTETGIQGYYVYRARNPELQEAQVISPLITAANSPILHQYSFTDYELLELGQYHYWLQSSEFDGTSSFYGPVSVLYTNETEQPTPGLPVITGIKSIFPNPFNPNTTISYVLKNDIPIEIVIFNARGQKIRSFENLPPQAGEHRVHWDGRDARGIICGSGVYYIQMQAGNELYSRKAVLMK